MLSRFHTISRVLFILCLLSTLVLAACGDDGKKDEKTETKTIGVLNISPGMELVLAGFKDVMASEFGYIEGENVTYIYGGPSGSVEGLDPLIDDLKTHDLDLVLAFGTPPAQKAEAAFADTSIPVIFGPVNDPIAAGLVETIAGHPENVTGIQNGASVAKGLDWLVQTMPGVEQVYVPHNPLDSSSVASLASIQEVAPGLGIELLIGEVTTSDELTEALANIPEDADAVLVLRVAMFDARTADIVSAATEKDLPAMVSRSDVLEFTGAIIGFGPDFYNIGQRMARLADQVFKGTEASALPIETAEEFLSVNLAAARAIGVEIPDAILRQANNIVGQTAESE
ncbi:MAG: ABC transporter substrate-binding protein [Anaerolineae bacterium]|nr:ABC transporter substrate-binding protein [Anaerolineae bacterium]